MGSGDVLPYISVAIKASFLKFKMCNIYKNNITNFFPKFKIVDLIKFFFIFCKKSCESGISKLLGGFSQNLKCRCI